MTEYIVPVLIFGAIGLVAGVLLSIASKVFEVKSDARVESIKEILPGVNCGACGYAGCEDYAAAIVEKNVRSALCKPGGEDVAAAIDSVMGKSGGKFVREIAVVHCGGDCTKTNKQYKYTGLQSCAAAKRSYGGDGNCNYGCMGYGDCAKVCIYGAIVIDNNIAFIDRDVCKACAMCVKTCPNSLISIHSVDSQVDILCSSKEPGKTVKQNCKSGCIGCKICVKKCPENAIVFDDNLARIDHSKCTNCGTCISACPVGTIR
ncbi:MAG: RnfABCDGE type electron transport complex subunit B [Oscillospiraceae bacterium]|jgi:Na+-translocating ferredoxin:NAD+ oxidoreductase RNF subunit RnfB|nr:RnfABCDGE type electron transport complex subunit B [Oscillospiraceae bacterium]